MAITGTIPPPEVIQRFEDGVRVIDGRPYMSESDDPQRWVYADIGKAYYYNTDTGEVRLRDK
jgi:hypothetical protein